MTDESGRHVSRLPFGPYEGDSVDTVAVKDPDYLAALVREAVGTTDLRADAARALATRGRLGSSMAWDRLARASGWRTSGVGKATRVVGIGLALVMSALLAGRCVDTATHVLNEAGSGSDGPLAAPAGPPVGAISLPGAGARAASTPAPTFGGGQANVDFVPEPTRTWTDGAHPHSTGAAGARAPGGSAADARDGADTCGERLDGAVSAAQAHEWVGTHQAVEFRVVRAKDTGRVTFLNSHDPYQGHFYVAIFPSDYDRFADHPARLFDGRCIVVQGTIELYRGAPQIVLRDPADVRLVDG